jgi:hypothetical protein
MQQEGMHLVDEAFYDVMKIKFKVKAIEYLNNIVENRFQMKEEDFNVKNSIGEIVEVVKKDLEKSNIELDFTYGENPQFSKGD